MDSINDTLDQFCARLASSAPTPGGGGAAALAGALAAALGEMVANLTLGKKKYAAVENDVHAACETLTGIREQLLAAIDADAEAFLPLSAAYKLPEGAEKEQAMEQALAAAIEAPLAAMEAMAGAIEPLAYLAKNGSRLAVSDAGAGAALLSGALRAESLNIFINASSMRNRSAADAYLETTGALLINAERADEIFNFVAAQLRAGKEA